MFIMQRLDRLISSPVLPAANEISHEYNDHQASQGGANSDGDDVRHFSVGGAGQRHGVVGGVCTSEGLHMEVGGGEVHGETSDAIGEVRDLAVTYTLEGRAIGGGEQF